MNRNRLWYEKPAPDRGVIEGESYKRDPDWESWSLPLGCGYFGACVFGKTDQERIQITENSLANPYRPGLNNFAEMRIETGHTEELCTDYQRDLDLNEAVSHVRYTYQGVQYRREYICSYPDHILAVAFAASKPGSISFRLKGQIPYLRPFGEKERYGKEGTVTTDGEELVLQGRMEYYNILFEGRFSIQCQGGTITAGQDWIEVSGADRAVLLGCVGTSYQIKESVFLEPDPEKKLSGLPHPHEKVAGFLRAAKERSWEEIKEDHCRDHARYFSRVTLQMGEEAMDDLPTDQRLERYRKGNRDPGLEALYFQYGRYLLIASSRKGALPANLQGVWNQYEESPWSAGYWHNINVQMNYWHAFTTDLPEMFESYVDYNQAFFSLAKQRADEYVTKIRKEYPLENYSEQAEGPGRNGWAIGTGAWPYTITGPTGGGRSGPGNTGLTARLFWDYYDFTRDKEILKQVVYPLLEEMSRFMSKTVVKEGDEYLVYPSASPEQCVDGIYPNYYLTKGCMFDQQMMFECYRDTKKAAAILQMDSDIQKVIDQQIDHLSPVLIGDSGQIKEYREERTYGEIGEKKHRHISQLMGLMPGQSIWKDTPEWIEAAKYTLTQRGDESTGWGMAHRLNAWARTGDGEHAYRILQKLLSQRTAANLWNIHPPFQIDGNFGGTAGIAEMLLQSNNDVIELLPAIPSQWESGCFKGLVARGNFAVDVRWEQKTLTEVHLYSRAGGFCEIRYPGLADPEYYQIQTYQGEISPGYPNAVRWQTQKGQELVVRKMSRCSEKSERNLKSHSNPNNYCI